MRFFYGLYVKNEELAASLDLIRFLAEPKFFRRAHITVRGPYTQRIADQIASISRGKTYQIVFGGIGNFFEGKQNTVFLKCEVPGIEEVWSKPDFGNKITPHVTFYDGTERTFAYGILNELNSYRWDFSVESTVLMEIEAKTNPSVYLDEFRLHQKVHDQILGRHLDYREIQTLSWRRRLPYISEVANFVGRNFSLAR
jgi:2'-5' RNA ligase